MTIGAVDQVQEGLGMLLGQFRDNDDVIAVVSAPLRQLNVVETALQNMLKLTSIDDALGVQLDVLGRILMQPRGQKDDATYRTYLYAKVAALRSNGSVPGLYSPLRITDPLGTYQLKALYPANARMNFVDPPLETPGVIDRAQLLKVAKAGGVGLFLFWMTDVPANVFQFKDSGGSADGTPWGDEIWGDEIWGGGSSPSGGNGPGNAWGSHWSPGAGGRWPGITRV